MSERTPEEQAQVDAMIAAMYPFTYMCYTCGQEVTIPHHGAQRNHWCRRKRYELTEADLEMIGRVDIGTLDVSTLENTPERPDQNSWRNLCSRIGDEHERRLFEKMANEYRRAGQMGGKIDVSVEKPFSLLLTVKEREMLDRVVPRWSGSSRPRLRAI